MGKSGPVRIQGVELTRVGNLVRLRAVHTRGHALPQFIEVPLTAQILRRMGTELEAFATRAEAETRALHRHRHRRPEVQTVRSQDSQDPM